MVRVTNGVDLAELTTMRLPAECAEFCEYDTLDDLRRLHADGKLEGAFHLGGGSNVLFVGGKTPARVCHSRMRLIEAVPDAAGDTVAVTAQSGVTLDDLVAMTCAWGLWGLENLSMIPGHIGGAAVQNVGAYGAELADVVTSVTALDVTDGSMRTFTPQELDYGYRHSIFKTPEAANRYVVTSVSLTLRRKGVPNLGYKALASAVTPDATPEQMRQSVMDMRRAKLPDPATVGSVGSYFVNPIVDASEGERFRREHPEAPAFDTADGRVKLSAAWLIDHAGCKPLTCGGASLWPTQPLVIVNTHGNATGADIIGLEQAVRARVKDTFGITLQCEVVKP
ncbi:MAG: UDP-N-acetylmuramate dehydrogenase [Candidatus Amulumruptor caecigallinarius]|nr:UDP-N-acetylmuramate dehydrogenase [Candidatus Amulumruptor caecigallinarius]MCM1397708.1 UDP-N-acetylmuramate dehydrogenase [Candidatus Amulumruptor caecigallinarius]MCM1454724.1 UDP-N-acetylmuramate dehydrogenase [bacterium]